MRKWYIVLVAIVLVIAIGFSIYYTIQVEIGMEAKLVATASQFEHSPDYAAIYDNFLEDPSMVVLNGRIIYDYDVEGLDYVRFMSVTKNYIYFTGYVESMDAVFLFRCDHELQNRERLTRILNCYIKIDVYDDNYCYWETRDIYYRLDLNTGEVQEFGTDKEACYETAPKNEYSYETIRKESGNYVEIKIIRNIDGKEKILTMDDIKATPEAKAFSEFKYLFGLFAIRIVGDKVFLYCTVPGVTLWYLYDFDTEKIEFLLWYDMRELDDELIRDRYKAFYIGE